MIGAGGVAQLQVLFGALEILFKRHAASGSGFTVTGYIVKPALYKNLGSGDYHPLGILESATRSPWWEDAWDQNMWRRAGDHWPGSVSLFASVMREQQESPFLSGVMAKWRAKQVRREDDVPCHDQSPFYGGD